jgi:hypothetical protein
VPGWGDEDEATRRTAGDLLEAGADGGQVGRGPVEVRGHRPTPGEQAEGDGPRPPAPQLEEASRGGDDLSALEGGKITGHGHETILPTPGPAAESIGVAPVAVELDEATRAELLAAQVRQRMAVTCAPLRPTAHR